MNKRDKVEVGGKVAAEMMVVVTKRDEVPALAAKEKAERRKVKYQTWNGR